MVLLGYGCIHHRVDYCVYRNRRGTLHPHRKALGRLYYLGSVPSPCSDGPRRHIGAYSDGPYHSTHACPASLESQDHTEEKDAHNFNLYGRRSVSLNPLTLPYPPSLTILDPFVANESSTASVLSASRDCPFGSHQALLATLGVGLLSSSRFPRLL